MITVLIISILTAAALLWCGSKRIAALEEQVVALSDRLDTLSRKSGKRFNKYEKKLAQQRHRQMQQAAKQEKLRKEQEKLSREQRRQAVSISKMKFKLSQALADFETGKDRLSQLYALLDIAEDNRAAAMPGTAQDVRYQKQIVTLTAQIAATEKRMEKARFDAQTAREVLAA